jgi:glycosyltransferase involved in cell wall biosynthesis
VSVIVPCHNEAKVLAQTLENLCSQQYSGPFPEIIVALNGCTDASWAVAQGFGVRVIEDEKCGMSFGKNLGARAATGELLIFVDADTQLPTGGLQAIVESMYGKENAIGTIAGAPDHGGLVVRACFILANRNTRRTQTHAPGGVMAMPYAVWKKLGGFDENILQGTSTDMILRALKTGAEYVFIDRIAATTSVRRFEKTGIVRQMLSWRNNHLEMKAGKRKKIAREKYEAYR